jgi:hypothetical protein
MMLMGRVAASRPMAGVLLFEACQRMVSATGTRSEIGDRLSASQPI